MPMIVLNNCKDLPQKLTQNEYFYIQNSGEQQNWFQDKITGTQCTQQKLKLISGLSHSRSVNTMPQRIAKSSSKYPPKTQ